MARRVADGTRLWNGLRISLGFATLSWSDEMFLLALRSRLTRGKDAPWSIHIFRYFPQNEALLLSAVQSVLHELKAHRDRTRL